MRKNLFNSKPALLVAAGLSLAVAGGVATMATATAPVAKTAPAKEGEFLFVQTSKGMTWDAGTGTLALTGVSPTTLFFTDRPNRVAGNMTTASFVPFWSKGKDSFSKDPPNADISILENGKLQQVVVELKSPALKGDTLTYNATIIAGKMPAKGANVAVFIDIIGMPMTPVSAAGVARRSYARAVIR